MKFFLREHRVQELDEAECLRIPVDQAERVGDRRGSQQFLVLVFSLVRRKAAPLQVPILRAVKEESEKKE